MTKKEIFQKLVEAENYLIWDTDRMSKAGKLALVTIRELNDKLRREIRKL